MVPAQGHLRITLWGQQHDWLYDKLQRFHMTFSQPIKQLDANAFTAEAAEACSTPASDA